MADITINEVRRRLQLFAKEHSGDRDEKQYAQQFMRDFYACFGLSKSSASMFEKKVLKFGNKRGFIDSFIPGADDDASRVAFLFKRYEELTSLLPATVVKKKRVNKNNNDLLI